MDEKRAGIRGRGQKLLLEPPLDPTEFLTEENKAVLSYFASEIARYIEMGMNRRLENVEYRLQELDTRPCSKEEARAVREILGLFSKYKLFRILQALSKHASDDRGFTKNSLIRAAGVGQSFRKEGLDRLIDILSSCGVLMESGKRGRGVVFCVTGMGKRFLQSYVPRFSSLPSNTWSDRIWEVGD